MLYKLYAYPADNNWMKTKIGLFQVSEINKLIDAVSRLETNEQIEVTGDNFTVVRNSNGSITSEGKDTASINKLEKALVIATFQSRKVVC